MRAVVLLAPSVAALLFPLAPLAPRVQPACANADVVGLSSAERRVVATPPRRRCDDLRAVAVPAALAPVAGLGVLTTVILVHELGHYWWAQLCLGSTGISSEDFAQLVERRAG